jgi:hypothetical protein
MAIQLGALRDALMDAGASPESAAKAAEEVAAYESGFTYIKIDLAAIRGEQTLMMWMLATVLAINITIALRLFIH